MELLTIIVQCLVLVVCMFNTFLSYKLHEKNAKNAWIVASLGWGFCLFYSLLLYFNILTHANR